LKIAIFVESPVHSGGGFQQSVSVAEQLARFLGNQIIIITTIRENVRELSSRGLEAHFFPDGAFHRSVDIAAGLSPSIDRLLRPLRRIGLKSIGRSLDRFLGSLRVDLVYFTAPTYTAVRLADHSYVFTVWDLCHRDFPEFPEVSSDREFERRDQLLVAALPKAVAVIADSPAAAGKMARWYGVDPARITVLPHLPSAAVRRYVAGESRATASTVRSKYALPAQYAFYPAQTWAHKNHVYILAALGELERRSGRKLDVVFCGSDKGNSDYVRDRARALGLAERVHMLGFVADDDIPAIYDGALALVMPSYFGSTNIPPLEAAAIGCPVIYSDSPDFREQMRDAALYCDLSEPASLAQHLETLLRDPQERERLRIAGRNLTREMAAVTYEQRLRPIFEAVADKRRTWRGTSLE
jgi:glycosyltransferase involved in cell wall biosynthesis